MNFEYARAFGALDLLRGFALESIFVVLVTRTAIRALYDHRDGLGRVAIDDNRPFAHGAIQCPPYEEDRRPGPAFHRSVSDDEAGSRDENRNPPAAHHCGRYAAKTYATGPLSHRLRPFSSH